MSAKEEYKEQIIFRRVSAPETLEVFDQSKMGYAKSGVKHLCKWEVFGVYFFYMCSFIPCMHANISHIQMCDCMFTYCINVFLPKLNML